MALPRPTPAYFQWRVYKRVRPAEPQKQHEKATVSSSCDDDAAATQSAPSSPDAASHSQLRNRRGNESASTSAGAPLKSASGGVDRERRRYTLHVRESLLTPLSVDPHLASEEVRRLPALVLLHGMVVSGDYLAAVGSCLAPYFRVFIPDLPGYGRSADSLSQPGDCLSVTQQVDLIVAWLRRAKLLPKSRQQQAKREEEGDRDSTSSDDEDQPLDDEPRLAPDHPPFFLGQSMGNHLVVDLARRYPECIRAGVLQGAVQDAPQGSAVGQLLQFALNGRNEAFFQARQMLHDYQIAGWRRVWATWRAQREGDIERWMRDVRTPLLLLFGELDAVSGLEWNIQLAAAAGRVEQEQSPRVFLSVLLDCPHTACTVAPEAAAEMTREYINNVIDAEERQVQLRGGGAGTVRRDLLAVEPPRLTLDHSLTWSQALSFVPESAGAFLIPALLFFALSLIAGTRFALSRTMLLYALVVSLATLWRVWHRRNLLLASRSHHVALWPSSVVPPPIPGVADFDSATGFLRAHALALRGHSVTLVGRPRFPLDRPITWLLNHLPQRVRLLAYAILGAAEAKTAWGLERSLDSDAVAAAVVRHYPNQRTYPGVALGSSNGALSHLYHALGMPWLPNTLLFGVARPSPRKQRDPFPGLSRQQDRSVFDLSAEWEWGREKGQRLLRRMPEWALHHMADPNQDSLMVPFMSYFRFKQLRLPQQYREFLLKHLQPGGTILLSDCKLTWPACVRISERHFFQMGAYGGIPAHKYVQPNPEVDAMLRRSVLRQTEDEIERAQSRGDLLHFNAPAPNFAPVEAEWGLPPAFRTDVEQFARENGFKLVVLEHDDPQDAAAPVADLLREWNTSGRLEGFRRESTNRSQAQTEEQRNEADKASRDPAVTRLVLSGDRAPPPLDSSPLVASSRLHPSQQHLFVCQFLLVEQWWCMRTGAVPFWSAFPTRPSLLALRRFLSQRDGDEAAGHGARFRDASAGLFPHGAFSAGFADVHSWLRLLRSTRWLTHPRQCSSGDHEPSVSRGGGVLVGVREDWFPRDFQTMLHFHEHAHMLTQQRYAMPSRPAHFMPMQQALHRLQLQLQHNTGESQQATRAGRSEHKHDAISRSEEKRVE